MSNEKEKVVFPSYNIAETGLTGLLQFLQTNTLNNLEKVAPARVVSYDRIKNRATVQILNQSIYSTGEKMTRKPITDIPVLTLFGGNFGISFPIKQGDIGWIVAADRNISLFKQFLDLFTPATFRKHKYEDGFFIPDKVNGFNLTEEDTNALVITSLDGQTKISVNQGTVTITASNTVINSNVTVNGSVTATGDVIGANISLSTHTHGGVEAGGSSTGLPQ